MSSHGSNGNGNGLASHIDRMVRIFLIVAAAGVGLCLLGALYDADLVLQSYLIGYFFWLGIPLGCTSLLLLNHLAGGTWGLVIRRPLEAGAATMPLMTLLFLPVVLGVATGSIFPWAEEGYFEHGHGAQAAEHDGEHDGDDEHDDVEQVMTKGLEPGGTFADDEVTEDTDGGETAAYGHKELYFDLPFFFGRAAGYFVVWNLFAFLLIRWSTEQDEADDPGPPSRRLDLIGAPGLILLFGTGTFAAFDWGMSLDPHWYSTIYGAMVIVGMGLETFAFIIFVTSLLADRGELEDLPRPSRLRDLGNLMLAFVMLWAYIAYSQLLIIWSGNLTEEIPWYLARTNNGWQYFSTALVVFHFFLPFFALLFRVNKEQTLRLRLIAAAIFVVHLFDVYWLLAPSMDHYPYESPAPDVMAVLLPIAAAAGVGGLWLAAYALMVRRRPLVPRNDPDLVALRAHDQNGHEPHLGGA